MSPLDRGKRLTVSLVLIGALAVVAFLSFPLVRELAAVRSDDPLAWEEAVAALEASGREVPPPQNAIVFVGSSSIRLWDSLPEDMAPLPTIRRGFGGAKSADIVYYSDRLVSAYAPRAVVVYVGGNDMTGWFGSAGHPPEHVFENYLELARRLHARQPGLPIYFVALKPSRYGSDLADRRRANHLIAEHASRTPYVNVIDANAELETADGGPRDGVLRLDGLHLTEAGYAAWGPPIRERLLNDVGTPEERAAAARMED